MVLGTRDLCLSELLEEGMNRLLNVFRCVCCCFCSFIVNWEGTDP